MAAVRLRGSKVPPLLGAEAEAGAGAVAEAAAGAAGGGLHHRARTGRGAPPRRAASRSSSAWGAGASALWRCGPGARGT